MIIHSFLNLGAVHDRTRRIFWQGRWRTEDAAYRLHQRMWCTPCLYQQSREAAETRSACPCRSSMPGTCPAQIRLTWYPRTVHRHFKCCRPICAALVPSSVLRVVAPWIMDQFGSTAPKRSHVTSSANWL